MADEIGPAATVIDAVARVGGGALPLVDLPGPAVAVSSRSADELAARLRAGDPAVIVRIDDGRVVLDPRTLTDAEAALAAQELRRELGVEMPDS
jgi:L-seryl-tRNA(Ser) seleniumtransferase